MMGQTKEETTDIYLSDFVLYLAFRFLIKRQLFGFGRTGFDFRFRVKQDVLFS
jgi:hypothetical protein